MEPIDIQYQLKKRGIMQKDIARALSVSDNVISRVVNKQVVSDRIMRAVAAAIECDPEDVFSEYYRPPERPLLNLRVTNNPSN